MRRSAFARIARIVVGVYHAVVGVGGARTLFRRARSRFTHNGIGRGSGASLALARGEYLFAHYFFRGDLGVARIFVDGATAVAIGVAFPFFLFVVAAALADLAPHRLEFFFDVHSSSF